MELWRISNYSDLSGIGGLRAAGRWHSQGKRIVYLADHQSSALLEMLVHMDRDLIPPTYQLLRVMVPNDVGIEGLRPKALGPDWRSTTMTSREIGDRWLDSGASALLRVPSAISEGSNNFLLNPAHADAQKVTVVEITKAPFDPRLLSP
jgi:RES domain-containing protein